eukprot:jgi/Mesvir1/21783/Mv04179-RA.1
MQVLGVALAVLSSMYAFALTAIVGVAVGVLLILVGFVGYIGASHEDRRLIHFYLVGVLLTMMLSLQYMGQVQREMSLDCALAEMQGRVQELEARRQQQSTRDQLFSNVFARIDEMEDVIAFLGERKDRGRVVADASHKDGEAPELAIIRADRQFLHTKLRALQKHAKDILEQDRLAHAEASDDNLTPEERETIRQLSPEERADMRKRLVAAEEALDLIEYYLPMGVESAAGVDMSLEEYTELLKTLTKAWDRSIRDPVKGAAARDKVKDIFSDFPRVKTALQRLEELEHYEPPPPSDKRKAAAEEEADATRLSAFRQNQLRWKMWADKLRSMISSNELEIPSRDLPQHCVVMSRGWKLMAGVGLLGLMLQLFSAFVGMSLAAMTPVKGGLVDHLSPVG